MLTGVAQPTTGTDVALLGRPTRIHCCRKLNLPLDLTGRCSDGDRSLPVLAELVLEGSDASCRSSEVPEPGYG